MKLPSVLVFSGGGVRGVSYVGALQQLCEQTGFDYWSRGEGGKKNIVHTCGTSIGALVALLVACGMKPEKLVDMVLQTRMDTVVNVSAITILSDWGLTDGNKLKTWVESLLFSCGVPPRITLGEFEAFTGVRFTCVATDINWNKATYLSADNFPSMPVTEAVCMSMSLPLLFKPREWSVVVDTLDDVRRCDVLHVNGGGEPVCGSRVLVRHSDWAKAKSGTVTSVGADSGTLTVDFEQCHLFLDGGLADNFPVQHMTKLYPASEVLALCLKWGNTAKLSSIEQYMSRVAYCTMSCVESSQFSLMPPETRRRCVKIPTGDVSTINFSLTPGLISQMIENGKMKIQEAIEDGMFDE